MYGKDPKTITPNKLASEAKPNHESQYKIDELVVIDEKRRSRLE